MKIYIIELGEGLETTRAILSTPTRKETKIGLEITCFTKSQSGSQGLGR